MVGITIGESLCQARLFSAAPFELVGVQYPVVILNVVHPLLLLCAPEMAFAIECIVGVAFHTFADKVVLPECPCVIAQTQRFVIAQYGVSDTIIIEIYFTTFFQFGTHVSAERPQVEQHIRFFQQVNISLYGNRRKTESVLT